MITRRRVFCTMGFLSLCAGRVDLCQRASTVSAPE
jgi:hypothetical protein